MLNRTWSFFRFIRKSIKQLFNYCKWFLLRPCKPIGVDGKIKLHIGCGDIVIPDFINIDARPLSHVHFLSHRLWNLRQFKTNTVDFIYLCHVLEHVNIHHLSIVFNELFRILNLGGVVRISVPDFDLICSMYNQCERRIESVEQIVMGGQMYRQNEHHAIFNRQYLQKLLCAAGFHSVREWNPSTAKYRGFNDWASTEVIFENQSFAISLNIEAEK